MSKLANLIKMHCPKGVKYSYLSELAEIGTGSRNSKDAEENGLYPFYVRSQTPLYLNEYDYDDVSIITAGDGVGVGKVFHITTGKYALHQRAYRIHPNNNCINTKYLYYCFTSFFYDYIMMAKYMGSVSSVRLPMLKNFIIPTPPLLVQDEIVRILDIFTEHESALEEELETELVLRKKQYEHFRDKILSLEDFKGEIRNYSLSKLVTQRITDGMHNLPKKISSKGFAPILSAANIYDGKLHFDTDKFVDEDIYVQENRRTDVNVGDVLLTIVASIGRVAVIKEPVHVLLQRSVSVIKPNQEIILSDYLKYYLETQPMQSFMLQNAHGAAQKGFYVNQINDLQIKIPVDLGEQKRIVDILKVFEKNTFCILEELPCEIKMRHQQYEYYRKKILTFDINEK